jgi:hypothetical protein
MQQQYLITPSMGKRIISKALAAHDVLRAVLRQGTLVIIAGTTNGYVAEEILGQLGQDEDFSRTAFFRGITVPPSVKTTDRGRLVESGAFPGDVVIVNGRWQKGKTIFDIVDDLEEGDVILKGANALDLARRQAATFIGDPKAGTIGEALKAVVGRRVRLIIPAGLEKRVDTNLYELANRLNTPGARGPRLLPVPGEPFTELDAIHLLTGARAELVAAGGVHGAEGSVWIGVRGITAECEATDNLIASVSHEPAFSL